VLCADIAVAEHEAGEGRIRRYLQESHHLVYLFKAHAGRDELVMLAAPLGCESSAYLVGIGPLSVVTWTPHPRHIDRVQASQHLPDA
jgi:hypothetical protein